jgi:hypothetical protein
MTAKVITLDARRRVSLAKVGRKQDRLYIVDERADGSIALIPARVTPANQNDCADGFHDYRHSERDGKYRCRCGAEVGAQTDV